MVRLPLPMRLSEGIEVVLPGNASGAPPVRVWIEDATFSYTMEQDSQMIYGGAGGANVMPIGRPTIELVIRGRAATIAEVPGAALAMVEKIRRQAEMKQFGPRRVDDDAEAAEPPARPVPLIDLSNVEPFEDEEAGRD